MRSLHLSKSKAKVALSVPTGRTGQRPGDGGMAHEGGSGGAVILWC